MKNLLSIVLVLSLSIFISACAGRKSVQEGVAVEDRNKTGEGSSGGASGSGTGIGSSGSGSTGLGSSGGASGSGGALSGVGEDDPLSKRTIYFEYDSTTLTPEGRAIVEAHAAYLASNPGLSLTLEGHADERGTREYNLALGESRAKAVKRLMQALGVSDATTQTISYGEERPVALGTGDEGWSLNRRVEILYGN